MTSGNPILDKNLECINKYNSALVKKLLNLPFLSNDIQLIETELKEPNLSYNGAPLHSPKGAEAEAKAIFDKSENTQPIAHFILGIGLGYLFKEFCERSVGKVILFEDNLEILRVTLELVDFSKELSQTNVRIASDFTELKQIFFSMYEYKIAVNFALLDSYRLIYGEAAQKILNQIDSINKASTLNFHHLKGMGFEHILAIFANFPYTMEETPLQELRDIYKGETALIVSAGPTLDSNIEIIKKNRDKFIIFCVGTAYKSLEKHGIVPDFLNVIENLDCSGQVKGFDLSDINFILEPSTNNSFHQLKTKHKFLYPSNSGQWGTYWCKLTNVDGSIYKTCGTVALEAINSAKILGFKTIILVGQDLAFVNNSCYSKESAYSDLVFEVNPTTGKPEYKINNYDSYIKSIMPADTNKDEQWCRDFAEQKLKNLNDSLCFVKGIEGDMLPTKQAFAMFIDGFVEFALANKDLKLINTSLTGAQIDGYENIPLEKALENAEPVKKIDIPTSYEYNKELILDNLKMDKTMLQEISSQIYNAKNYILGYEKEMQENNEITKNAGECVKKLLAIYRNLYSEYFAKNLLFNIIAFSENTELEYRIKTMNKEEKDHTLEFWYSILKEYFTKVDNKVQTVLELIEKNIHYFA